LPHIDHDCGARCRELYRLIGGCTQLTIQEAPGEAPPGASSSFVIILVGTTPYNASYLCFFRCIGGDHDCAAAPRDPPRRACELSHALRILGRDRGRTIVSLSPSSLLMGTPCGHAAAFFPCPLLGGEQTSSNAPEGRLLTYSGRRPQEHFRQPLMATRPRCLSRNLLSEHHLPPRQNPRPTIRA
jgi:hypothetical protein